MNKFIFALVGSLLFSGMHNSYGQSAFTKEKLIEELFDIGSIQFGDFVLKVTDGYISTPIYIDMRRIMSHPDLMQKVVSMIAAMTKDLHYNLVCGVPYAALPYAVGVSLEINKPMIMSRQTAKHYGTCKAVEGVYKEGDVVLLIEDVIVSGASVIAATHTLRHAGLVVNDVIVLCDRQQGAIENMKEEGLRPHIIFSMQDLLEVLEKKQKLEPSTADLVRRYIAENQCP
jgi:uridine monophosphate synthetase